jgi:addiction module RelE/StbE family toxin
MKAVRFSGAFTKDLKRIAKRGYDPQRLESVVDALRHGTPLPAAVRPHPLLGEWKKSTGSAMSRRIGC